MNSFKESGSGDWCHSWFFLRTQLLKENSENYNFWAHRWIEKYASAQYKESMCVLVIKNTRGFSGVNCFMHYLQKKKIQMKLFFL